MADTLQFGINDTVRLHTSGGKREGGRGKEKGREGSEGEKEEGGEGRGARKLSRHCCHSYDRIFHISSLSGSLFCFLHTARITLVKV